MRKILFLLLITLFSTLTFLAQQPASTGGGSLYARDKQGALGFCPLKSTKVRADISGFFARVTVQQEFDNTYSDPIEAVYTFPLSQNSAVDRMTMTIGDRVIRGRIMKREEAKKVYEAARAAGQAAALLDQQRPNIFTQSVANIMPGEKVVVEISYVETLKYDDGSYEFVFPMVVGQRYNPASVPRGEAKAVTPPIATERTGHDVSIDVNLDAGVPIEEVRSVSHEIETIPLGAETRKVALKNLRAIANKDFILRYDVTGKRIQDGLLVHRGAKGGFFTLMIQPPDSFAPKDVNPKEIVFVLDTSGSMNGFPISKAKEAMNLALDGLNPRDTFNLITFAGDTRILFDRPVPATEENLATAREFLNTQRGGGGTEMMKAVIAALSPTESQRHVRIACFMTDGYVGNESQIIAEVQRYPNARVFAFGIGNAVNRFLLDKMASEGRGEVEYVTLKDDGSKAARRFHERVRNPLLTDIRVDWNGLAAADVYPGRQPDLYSAKPVALSGRFGKSGTGTAVLHGKMAGRDYSRDIPLTFPETEAANDALATIWARARVDDLMSKFYAATPANKPAIEDEVTQLGLEFGLMTQFTSFVAVEERVVNQDGRQVRIEVPVEMAEGTFGRELNSVSGGDLSSQSISILPTARTAQGLYSNAPTVPGAGLTGSSNMDRSPAVAGSAGPENNLILDGVSKMTTSQINQIAAPTTAPKAPAISAGANLLAILKRIEASQLILKTLRSNIKMSTFESETGKLEERDGRLLIRLGVDNSAIRIDWKTPLESMSLVNQVFTSYRPELMEVHLGKPADAAGSGGGIDFLNRSHAELKAGYTIKLLGVEGVAPDVNTWHLELKPKSSSDSAPARSIHIWVTAEGLIAQLKFIEKNGDYTTFLITTPERNISLKPEDFSINVPPGTKVIKIGEPVTQ